MTDYDFRTLDDKEFEVLCVDLLTDVHGVRFERFKRGRDGGVDGRYFSANGKEVILQCKHRVNTPTKQVIASLKAERVKIQKLQPGRYLLAISNRLSRADKDAITEVLFPFIQSPSDILGNEDLNDLLAKRPGIESRHYKLWICSASILAHLINLPIRSRSASSMEEIMDSAKRYVRTQSHELAVAMLERLRVIIITGEPGVGKTTLAEHLSLAYVSQGFQFNEIAEEIYEAEGIFVPGQKQIFYFDDFLGRNYLQALTGHEGNHIVRFIRRVQRDSSKRFVLTSRSAILNQGKILIDTFRNNNIEKNEFQLQISALEELDKARILYSHIWHSNLQESFVEQLYASKRYRTVIGHRGFNPRLIRFITDSERLSGLSPAAYWKYVEETLNNPADVWENPFVAQQDDFSRAIVVLVTLNGRRITEDELASAYARYLAWPENQTMSGRRDFMTNIRHLTGSMLAREVQQDIGQPAFVSLLNPSIGDFVLRRIARDIPGMRAAFVCLRSERALSTLNELASNKFLSEAELVEILMSILREARRVKYADFEDSYILALLERILYRQTAPQHTEAIDEAIGFVLREGASAALLQYPGVLFRGIHQGRVSNENALSVVATVCARSPNKEQLSRLQQILKCVDPGHPGLVPHRRKFSTAAMAFLASNFEEEIDESDIFANTDYPEVDGARGQAEGLVEAWLRSFEIDPGECNIALLLDNYDFYDHGAKLLFRDDVGHKLQRGAFVEDEDRGIDDLFDRS